MSDVVTIGADDAAPKEDVVVVAEAGSDPLPAGAVLNADGTITLTLAYPVELKWKKVGSEEVTTDLFETLTFRRLRGADIRKIAAAKGADAGMVGMACSCGMTEQKFAQVFDRMDAADISAAGAVVARFLESGTKTGR